MDHTYIQLSREKNTMDHTFILTTKEKPQNSGKGERNIVLFGLEPKKYFSTTLINNIIVDEKKHPSPYRYSVN